MKVYKFPTKNVMSSWWFRLASWANGQPKEFFAGFLFGGWGNLGLVSGANSLGGVTITARPVQSLVGWFRSFPFGANSASWQVRFLSFGGVWRKFGPFHGVLRICKALIFFSMNSRNDATVPSNLVRGKC